MNPESNESLSRRAAYELRLTQSNKALVARLREQQAARLSLLRDHLAWASEEGRG